MGSENVRQEKAALRTQMQQIRDGLDPRHRAEASRAAADRLFSSPLVSETRTIMLYASIRSEVETGPFFEAAKARSMRIALPRVVREERRIEAVWVEGRDDLAPGTWGILEPRWDLPALDPKELELVVVPGLAFDHDGYRLGYGAGHYDRFLAGAPQAVWVGLTFEVCLVPQVPRETHDLAMHYILTGSRLQAAEGGPADPQVVI